MPKTYVTVQGDLFDTIAKKELGDEHYVHRLIEENFEYRNVLIFPAGVSLILPDITAEDSAQISEELPPWKR